MSKSATIAAWSCGRWTWPAATAALGAAGGGGRLILHGCCRHLVVQLREPVPDGSHRHESQWRAV